MTSSSSPSPSGDPLRDSVGGDLPADGSAELIRRARGGDEDALDELLRRYQEPLRRIVRIRLGARLRRYTESMDIVQNAYVVAARKLGEVDLSSQADFLQWLARIAERQIHDEAKRQGALKRDAHSEVPIHGDHDASASVPGGVFEPAAADSLPVDRALKNELRAIVDDEIGRLPDRYREVILLRDYQYGDWDFVAREVGAPNAHAASQLYQRAWIKLRGALLPRLELD